MKYNVEIVFDAECADYWVYINGEVEAFANSHSEAEDKAAQIVARMERHDRENAAKAQPVTSARSLTQAELEALCPDFAAVDLAA